MVRMRQFFGWCLLLFAQAFFVWLLLGAWRERSALWICVIVIAELIGLTAMWRERRRA